MVLVPGNHDVDWNLAKRSMSQAADQGEDTRERIENPASGYRWSWKEHQLLRIHDQAMYDSRLNSYRNFIQRFYQSVLPEVNADRAWNVFKFRRGDVVVFGFDSCQFNDCCCLHGSIKRDDVASAHMALRQLATVPRLCIAVWHHDLYGPPQRSDYMDPDTVRLLIDKGFRLGLHGHRHRADVSPITLETSDTQTMVVVSAGSLCAGDRDLPTGHNREYNIVTIDDDFAGAEMHVREMQIRGVFGPGRLTALGGKNRVKMKWTPATPSILR